MRRFALAAVLGMTAFGAVPASADPLPAVRMDGEVTYVSPPGDNPMVAGHCRVEGVAQETVTGGEDTFLVVLAGAAVAYYPPATPAPVEVRCYLRVNGFNYGSTPGGALVDGVDTTDGQWFIAVADTDDVDLCMVFGLSAGIGPVCADATSTSIPPW